MEKIETSPIPGSPGPNPNRAPENTVCPSVPLVELPSPLTEQKLPHAAFSRSSVTEKPVPEKKKVFEEYCEDHPYDGLRKIKQTYSFHCRIKNYEGPLEE